MTYNVFSGTLNATQSINQSIKSSHPEAAYGLVEMLNLISAC